MEASYRVATVQMTSNTDKAANLRTAVDHVRQAAARGARLVALPELFNCLGDPQAMIDQAETIPGPTSRQMSELAAELGIYLLAGSIAERSDETHRAFNTSLLFAPDGRELARYRKIHLFDIDLTDRVSFCESRWFSPGRDVVTVETDLGTIGLATCYDLRFPELFRRLADRNTELILLPSAFTLATGRDHWLVLLRARAIENLAYVVAPNQFGQHTSSMVSYGRSAIVDPWGTPLAICGDEEHLAEASIDLQRLRRLRAQLPALVHRRLH